VTIGNLTLLSEPFYFLKTMSIILKKCVIKHSIHILLKKKK